MAKTDEQLKQSLMDLLMQEKDIFKVYASFLPEGSCTQLRNILQKNMETITKQQFQVFEEMKNRNMYQLKDAQAQAITQAKQMLNPANAL